MSSSLPPYSLEPLSVDQSVRKDDLIALYESAQLFHRRPWLDYLVASPGVDVRLWAIGGAETTIGDICGGLVRKGTFLLLGSPLKGWGTNCTCARNARPTAAVVRSCGRAGVLDNGCSVNWAFVPSMLGSTAGSRSISIRTALRCGSST